MRVEELIKKYEEYKEGKISYQSLRKELEPFWGKEEVVNALEEYCLRESYDALFLLEEISPKYRIYRMYADPKGFLKRFEKEKRKLFKKLLKKVRKISVEKKRIVIELEKRYLEQAENFGLDSLMRELFSPDYEIRKKIDLGLAFESRREALKRAFYRIGGLLATGLLPFIYLHEYGHALIAYLCGARKIEVYIYPSLIPIFAGGRVIAYEVPKVELYLLAIRWGGAAAHQLPFSLAAIKLRKSFLNSEKVKNFLEGVGLSILLISIADATLFALSLEKLPLLLSWIISITTFYLTSHLPYFIWLKKKFNFKKVIKEMRKIKQV